MVTFSSIPINIRVPQSYGEFDSSRAVQGVAIQPYRVLIVGQKLGTGSQAALDPIRVTSEQQAIDFFGTGSVLHLMARTHFLNNSFTETWMVAYSDPGGGTAATGALTFGGTASAAGTLAVYIAGRRVQVGVVVGDTASAIATKAAAAISQLTDLPVTAAAVGSAVNLLARNAGVLGNDIDVRINYAPSSERTPAGVTVTVTAMSGGAGTVDLGALWAVLGDEQFNVITNPYTDATNLASMETELADRWGGLRQIEGFGFSAHSGNFAAAATFGASRNSQFYSVISSYGSPSPSWLWTAAYGAVVAFYGNQDPARPFQTLPLQGILPAAPADRFTLEERNLLLFDGISTAIVDAGGTVRIERAITTYQTNTFGAEDTSFLDVNTGLTLGFIRYSMRNRLLTRFPRHKLANNGTRISAGSTVVTPNDIRAELLALFQQWEGLGIVENADQFTRDLVVERSGTDPNRVDIVLPPDLVNQLRVTAAVIQFSLQAAA